MISVDISRYPFEEFVEFVFDHDVPFESEMPTSGERVRRWYYCTNAVFDLHRLSCHYVQLFTESAELLAMFSKPQLELGFSARSRMERTVRAWRSREGRPTSCFLDSESIVANSDITPVFVRACYQQMRPIVDDDYASCMLKRVLIGLSVVLVLGFIGAVVLGSFGIDIHLRR
jgi:hypothetical protein